MCLIDIDTPNGASYINTNGNLELRQKSPISSGTIARTLYYSDIFKPFCAALFVKTSI